jgi:glycosyltransferase involved in cell wall biosynthesis
MAELGKRHEVFCISFVDPNHDASRSLSATLAYCRRVVVVPQRPMGDRGLGKRIYQVRSLLDRHSCVYRASRSRAMQSAIDELVSSEAIDVVQIEFPYMTGYRFDAGARRPRVCLDEHNIEYDVLRRTAGADVGAVRRAYTAIEWRKVRREERSAWRSLDGCAVTSARDKDLLGRDRPKLRVSVVPNGVDVDSFAPTPEVLPEADTVLFFGAVNYHPNADGLLAFLRTAWPALKAKRPSARLRIVGPKPSKLLLSWPDPNVEVVGYVDDVRPHIARAAAVVVPLRIGGGTRLKVLEAMALGKAVVSTTLGAEGIDAIHERHLLLASDVADLALPLERVLTAPALGRRLGEAARSLVVERYSWRSSTEALLGLYAEMLAREDRVE